MADPKPITDFSKGIMSHPAFEGSFQGAADMLNWEIDPIGRPLLRKGYEVSTETELGTGAQVVKVHFIGDRHDNPVSKIYRFDAGVAWVYDAGRLFVTGDGNPKWIDIKTETEHVWGVDKPIGGINSITPAIVKTHESSSTNAADFRTFNFAIFYTWSSTEFSIESPPTVAKPVVIQILKNTRGNASVSFTVEYDFSGKPTWADGARIYIMISPFGEDDYRFIARPVPRIRSRNNLVNRGLTREDLFSPLFDDTEYDVSDIVDAGYRCHQLLHLTGSISSTRTENHRVELIYNQEVDSNDDTVFGVQISNESVAQQFNEAYLIGDRPPTALENIAIHAGRIWGYDPDTNTIRYSLALGEKAAFDVFPGETASIPHAIRLAENFQSKVQKIHPISNTGGLYVFFSNSIRTITGRAILTGMFSPQAPPQTDLDASGGYDGIGTLSPRTVISFRDVVLFLGSDKSVYQLLPGTRPQDLGLNIQTWLDAIPDDELPNCHAFSYNDLYHLFIPDVGVFRYDIKRNYWVRFDWFLHSAFWSRGGSNDESVLYAVDSRNRLIELYKGDTDGGEAINWIYSTNEWAAPEITNLHQVFVKVSGESEKMNIYIDNEGVVQSFCNNFTPTPYNRYRYGFFARGNLFRVRLTGTGRVPRISAISFT